MRWLVVLALVASCCAEKGRIVGGPGVTCVDEPAAEQTVCTQHAETKPTPSGYLAGGAIYNGGEGDAGFWVETGVKVKRWNFAAGASDMLTDAYRYRELELLTRYRLVNSFALEGGYGRGLSCRFAPPASCDHEHMSWNVPFFGVSYEQKIRKHLSGIFRGDVTPVQLSGHPFTHGKDDGLRVRFGVLITP